MSANPTFATPAARLGISVETYTALRAAGQKWCIGCKKWHAQTEFGVDRGRPDGLHAACRTFRNQQRRAGSRAVQSAVDTAPTTIESGKDGKR